MEDQVDFDHIRTFVSSTDLKGYVLFSFCYDIVHILLCLLHRTDLRRPFVDWDWVLWLFLLETHLWGESKYLLGFRSQCNRYMRPVDYLHHANTLSDSKPIGTYLLSHGKTGITFDVITWYITATVPIARASIVGWIPVRHNSSNY